MVRKAGVIFRTMEHKAKFSRWIAISVLMQILVLSGCPSPVSGDEDNDETQTYAVTYDANGAMSGSVPSAQTKTHGVALTLATNSGSLARTGYAFDGWNTKADGTGSDYAEGASYSTDAALILYTKWRLNGTPQTYQITYDANGATSGSAPAAQTKTHGVDLTLATNSGNLIRTGYTFAGWNSKNDGTGEDYAESASYSTDAGLILYAKWALITYSVTYDANGATSGSAPENQIKAYGVALTLATNNGNLADTYFAGWNTSPDGTGTDYAEGASYTIDAPLKLYAKWQSYSVGDTGPAGGVVFYDMGSYSEGWRYMEAEQKNLGYSERLSWNNDMNGNGTYNDIADYRFTNTPSDAIGSGETNTAKIIEVQGEGTYAASYCANLVSGGFDDWFLPSLGEVEAFMASEAWSAWYIANGSSGNLWSSTEATKTNDTNGDGYGDGVDYYWAWIMNMYTYDQWENYKFGTNEVVAIRSF